jgi:lipoteichoic acid synthase
MNKTIKEAVRKSVLVILFTIFTVLIYVPFIANSQYALLSELAVLNFLIFLLVIIPKKLDVYLGSFFLLIHGINISLQSVYFRAFAQYGSIATLLSLKSELTQVTSSIFEFVKVSDWMIFIYPILFWFIMTQLKSKLSQPQKMYLSSFIFLLISIISFSLYFLKVEESRKQYDDFLYYKSEHYIYTVVPSTTLFVDTYGLVSWTIRDIERSIIAPLFDQHTQENQDIKALMESKPTIPTAGIYNGIFADKSLLLIEAESLNRFAIDPVLTPTLYRLSINGFQFENYHSPLLFGSTSDAELMANTGLVPSNDGFVTFHKYTDNVYPQTLGSSFKTLGYKTLAVHNNYGEFYNRNIMMPVLGYDFLDCIGMGFQSQFVEDSKFAETLSWIMVEKEKMFTFWISFNGHQPYDIEEVHESWQPYFEMAKETYPSLSSEEWVYLAKTMDFDRAVSEIIAVYEMMGRLDDLVIAIYGDHSPKGIFEDSSNYETICSQRGMNPKTCLNTPFIIWNNDSFVGQSLVVSNPTDIPATLYDLFGIAYNPQLMFGTSIFDPNYLGFYFDAKGNIKTNHYTYNLSQDLITDLNGMNEETARLDVAKKIEELNLGHKIIENNYFKTLD